MKLQAQPISRSDETLRPTSPAGSKRRGRTRASAQDRQRPLQGVSGVVLAGVHSWGDCPLQASVPLPLVPIATQPLISHVLSWLGHGELAGASICANSDTIAIWRTLGDGSALNMALEYHSDIMPRGPGGCVRDAMLERPGDAAVVVDATVLPQIELRPLVEMHLRSKAAATVVVAESPEVGQEHLGISEPLGIYVFSRAAIECIPDSGYQDIKETLIPRLYAGGQRVVPYAIDSGLSPRVAGVASYLAVSEWALERIAARETIPTGYTRQGTAVVHRSANVDATARLEGPVLVGPGATVGVGALIVGPTAIGRGTVVEGRAVVGRSTLWDHGHIGRGAVVDHSIVTHHARIATDAVVRNAVRFPEHRGEKVNGRPFASDRRLGRGTAKDQDGAYAASDEAMFATDWRLCGTAGTTSAANR